MPFCLMGFLQLDILILLLALFAKIDRKNLCCEVRLGSTKKYMYQDFESNMD